MKKAKNWNQPCPNKTYSQYGQKNQGNIRSIGVSGDFGKNVTLRNNVLFINHLEWGKREQKAKRC
jgi:hypothetical protein